MPDVIEAVEVEEERGLTVREAEPMGLARAPEPREMIALATTMANALRDIVERMHLYADINGKKYPTVEAWMTIARMDNVVAREVPDGIAALEDGSYEATVELIRLSDGAIVGRGSALCGAEGDIAGKTDWSKRPRHQRRSMAVTRATSRAFRQHYAWIMVLAGYEPTPADEMPRDERPTDSGGRGGGLVDHPAAKADTTAPWIELADYTVSGAAAISTPPFDLELRPTADDGFTFGFKLHIAGTDKWIPQVVAEGSLAADIADAAAGSALLWTQPVTVTGDLYRVPWDKAGRPMPAFQRLIVKRLVTAEWTLPVDDTDSTEAELDRIAAAIIRPLDEGAK